MQITNQNRFLNAEIEGYRYIEERDEKHKYLERSMLFEWMNHNHRDKTYCLTT